MGYKPSEEAKLYKINSTQLSSLENLDLPTLKSVLKEWARVGNMRATRVRKVDPLYSHLHEYKKGGRYGKNEVYRDKETILDKIRTKIEDIKKELASFKGQAGLTFCGGEPFVQAKACKKIADWCRQEMGWNVWSFSGFTYEVIKEYGKGPWDFLKSLDALIDGPFILSQRDLSLRFRGSKNQRLLHLRQGKREILSIE